MGSAKDSFEQIKDHGAHPNPGRVNTSEGLKLLDSVSGKAQWLIAAKAAHLYANPH